MSTLRHDITIESLLERQRGRLPDLLGFRPIALDDTACGYACLAHLPPNAKNFTTIEIKSNHLGTAREGTISAVATGVHLGRSTQVWDATVSGPDGKTIALFRCTQMVLY